MTVEILGRRALGRALLARQLLLTRAERSAAETLTALVGMQAQAPLAPYVGLWSRLQNFEPGDLAEPLESRAFVRATLMRGTVHLVTAEDALRLRPLVEPAIVRGFRGGFGGRLTPEQTTDVIEFGRALLDERPHTRAELRRCFAQRWPDRDADAMAYAVSYLLPTAFATPRGVWGERAPATLTLLTTWLGRATDESPSIDEVVLRYLGAFGPATTKDVQAWSGLTRLQEVLDRLAPRLREFRSETGERLYDLPDAPRPHPDTPAPPRFLPEYDNVLLSHDDRSRIIEPGRRVPLPPGLGGRAGTVLLDGSFSGTWRLDADALRIALHRPDASDGSDLRAEATRLLSFLGGGPRAVMVHPA